MLRVTFYGVFTRRLAMSAGAKARLLPAPSRAPSGMSLTIGRNSRERRRGSKQGAGEVADRLRVFDPGCRLRVNATQRRRANHHIRLSSNAGQSRELFSADLRRVRVRVRAEHSGTQARPQRRRAQGGDRRKARLSNVFDILFQEEAMALANWAAAETATCFQVSSSRAPGP